jgi:hypothetical protein
MLPELWVPEGTLPVREPVTGSLGTKQPSQPELNKYRIRLMGAAIVDLMHKLVRILMVKC